VTIQGVARGGARVMLAGSVSGPEREAGYVRLQPAVPDAGVPARPVPRPTWPARGVTGRALATHLSAHRLHSSRTNDPARRPTDRGQKVPAAALGRRSRAERVDHPRARRAVRPASRDTRPRDRPAPLPGTNRG